MGSIVALCKHSVLYEHLGVDMAEFNETVFDHVSGDDYWGVSTGEMALRNRLEKLAKEHPDDVKCIAKNQDGSVFYHVPFKYLKLNPPRHISERGKEIFRETLRDARGFKRKSSE